MPTSVSGRLVSATRNIKYLSIRSGVQRFGRRAVVGARFKEPGRLLLRPRLHRGAVWRPVPFCDENYLLMFLKDLPRGCSRL